MHGKQGALVLMNPADFDAELPPSAHLFGEAQGRVVVTVRNEKQFAKLKEKAAAHEIKTAWIGTVGGENLRIRDLARKSCWKFRFPPCPKFTRTLSRAE